MHYEKCEIEGMVLIHPKEWSDESGYLFESFRAEEFCEQVGTRPFV
ncbi:MAG: dTDP-4-dehydrorhamnose 3,5-epimerase family protein, partial [Rikenellaceae bacterium]|nr:dTDP-4-dehydrorhamnose 3,5-epimerase family protein [Rikenellaceae bacterium]